MSDSRHKPKTAYCPWGVFTRRDFLRQTALAAAAASSGFITSRSSIAEEEKPVPRAPSTVRFCKRYDYPEIRRTLASMFDELGTVRKLVKNKYVTVKVNLVNVATEHVHGLPVEMTVVTHPKVALAVASLLAEYGAKEIRFCDQLPYRDPDNEAFGKYGYEMNEFQQETEGRARFVNTRNRGEYKDYELVKVPQGGFIANAWEVNRTYTETDVLVSLGKLKSHVSGGITLGLKNLFGLPPSSLYGNDLEDEPDEDAIGYRGKTMHSCERKPLTSVETFVGKTVEGDHGYNVPHCIADLSMAFPPSLTVIDGICTIQSAEGWWLRSMVNVAHPGLLLAGTNPVSTDAAGALIMGFNPEAEHRTHPFANGFNYLNLLREKGLGDNRVANLEIGGIGLEKARFHFLPTYERPRS